MDPRERLDDPQDAIRTAIDGALTKVWTSVQGIVTKVNLDPLTVEVQPATKAIVEKPDGTYAAVELPVLVDVPVVFQAGGGAMLTFPIAVGDECLVTFAARCIDAWWQQGGVQLPTMSRRHSLSDGFATVGPFSQPRKFPNWNPATAQLRTFSGDTYVEIDPADGFVNVVTPGDIRAQAGGSINAMAGADVTVNAAGAVDVTSGGQTHITAGGGCLVDADTVIDGNLRVNGNIYATGTITSQIGMRAPSYSGLTAGTGVLTVQSAVITTAQIAGKLVDTHTHLDPQGGSTGPMQ